MRLVCTLWKSDSDKNGRDPPRNECWRAQRTKGASRDVVERVRHAHRGFPQGLLRFDGTSQAHQDAIYSKRNEIIGLVLPSPRNCVRGRPTMTRGVAPKGPSVGRLGIDISRVYPEATRDPTVGVPPPSLQAVLCTIPSLMVCGNLLFSARYRTASFRGPSAALPVFDPSLSPSLVSRSSAARKSLHVSSTATPARPCRSSSSGRA
jgi:hypothetical protein